MKIVYVVTLGDWGGVATYLTTLINDQIHKHNKIWLITGSKGGLTQSIRSKYPSVNLILLPDLKRNIHIIDTMKAIIQFRCIIKRIRPDVIHLNSIMASIVGRLGTIGLHSKIIYTDHGWAFEPGTDKKFKWPAIIIEKILSYFTDKIICVSNYEYKIACKYHIFKNDTQGIVIRNAIPDIKISTSPKLYDNIFRITMAARFCSQKDQPDLIKSFNILNKLLPHKKIKLYLLGDGPTLDYCKRLVKKLNISDDVIFTGKVNNVFKYYNQSNVISLITHYDAISFSLIEALAMGKPIVASHVSGVPEDFADNGFCIQNKPVLIARAFEYLIKHKDVRIIMGHHSRKLYNKRYTLKSNLNAHNILYKKLFYK